MILICHRLLVVFCTKMFHNNFQSSTKQKLCETNVNTARERNKVKMKMT